MSATSDDARMLGATLRSTLRWKRPRPTAESLFDAFTRAQPVDRLSVYAEARYRLRSALALVDMPTLYRAQVDLALAEFDQAYQYDVARAAECSWFGAFGVMREG